MNKRCSGPIRMIELKNDWNRQAEKRSRCSFYVRCTNFLNLSPSFKIRNGLIAKVFFNRLNWWKFYSISIRTINLTSWYSTKWGYRVTGRKWQAIKWQLRTGKKSYQIGEVFVLHVSIFFLKYLTGVSIQYTQLWGS